MYRLKRLVIWILISAVVGCNLTAASASLRKPHITIAAVKKLTPHGYKVKKWLTADINRDRIKELIFVAEASKIQYGGPNNPPAVLMVFSKYGKSWRKIWQFSNGADYVVGRGSEPNPQEPVLKVDDINRDGLTELVFTFSSFGASDASVATYIFSYRNGQFIDLIGNKLAHSLDAGVILGSGRICFYQSDWVEGEAHCDPHRYRVEIYRWRIGVYILAERFLTKSKGTNGMMELKRRFKSYR